MGKELRRHKFLRDTCSVFAHFLLTMFRNKKKVWIFEQYAFWTICIFAFQIRLKIVLKNFAYCYTTKLTIKSLEFWPANKSRVAKKTYKMFPKRWTQFVLFCSPLFFFLILEPGNIALSQATNTLCLPVCSISMLNSVSAMEMFVYGSWSFFCLVIIETFWYLSKIFIAILYYYSLRLCIIWGLPIFTSLLPICSDGKPTTLLMCVRIHVRWCSCPVWKTSWPRTSQGLSFSPPSYTRCLPGARRLRGQLCSQSTLCTNWTQGESSNYSRLSNWSRYARSFPH